MVTQIIFSVLFIASLLSGLVPIIISIKQRKAFDEPLKALFIYLCCSVLTEYLSIIFSMTKHNVFPIQFCFCLCEFSIIIYLFWKELNKKIYHIVIISFACIYYVVLAWMFYDKKALGTINDFCGVIGSIMFIILALLFFFKVLVDLQIPKLTDYPFFWLNSAFLLYFGTTFFLFLFNSVIKDFDQTIVYFLTGIHHIVNITYNILIAKALWKIKKQ